MDVIPVTHKISARHTTSKDINLRYEDIAQDGRLRLAAMPECLARTVWGKLIGPSTLFKQLTADGIAPILTRVAIAGGEGPVSIAYPIKATGKFRFAHSLDDDAEVQRIVLNMWGEMRGPRSSVRDPQPDGQGQEISAGRIFAEHTLTRPFAEPGQRRVTHLEGMKGISPYPRAEYLGESPQGLLAIPRGAEAVDELSLEPLPVVFGLDDTDSNQHVNSLVYPRLFRIAALRRLNDEGENTAVMMRSIEMGFRKPYFAGDTAHIRIRHFRYKKQVAVTCTMGPLDDDATPNVFARIFFGP